MEAASMGKQVLWVGYWVISISEESGEKEKLEEGEAHTRTHVHRCIHKYYMYNTYVSCNSIHKYTQYTWALGWVQLSWKPSLFHCDGETGLQGVKGLT